MNLEEPTPTGRGADHALYHCEKFGYTAVEIARHLDLLELGAEDHSHATNLQRAVIQPNVEVIVEQFYAWLVPLPTAQSALARALSIDGLRRTQTAHLLTLGVGFWQADYFESRLRVGVAHVRVGLSLRLYQCAYRYLGQLIRDQVFQCPSGDVAGVLKFLHKILALDMSLAIETYHNVEVRNLQQNLKSSQQAQEHWLLKAQADSLTGLINRTTILGRLGELLSSMRLGGKPVAAVMVDIDHFKKINDSHGHVTGDKVLAEVAHRMQACLREFDDIGRYGGEEFLMIINGANLNRAMQLAERVRRQVATTPIDLRKLKLKVTISLGVSVGRPDDSIETLVKRADTALYAAKREGRNRVRASE